MVQQQSNPRRRPRGEAAGKLALYAKVDPRVMAFVRTASERLGISQAEFVDELLMHELNALDESGVPGWWPRPVPSAEELDLRAS